MQDAKVQEHRAGSSVDWTIGSGQAPSQEAAFTQADMARIRVRSPAVGASEPQSLPNTPTDAAAKSPTGDCQRPRGRLTAGRHEQLLRWL